jgi:hypothetical protein
MTRLLKQFWLYLCVSLQLFAEFYTDGHIHSLNTGGPPDDGNLVGFLHRIIDLEEADRETMHLLVFLLMQFLSRAEQVYVMS